MTIQTPGETLAIDFEWLTPHPDETGVLVDASGNRHSAEPELYTDTAVLGIEGLKTAFGLVGSPGAGAEASHTQNYSS